MRKKCDLFIFPISPFSFRVSPMLARWPQETKFYISPHPLIFCNNLGLSIDFLFTLFSPYLRSDNLLEIWISIYRYFGEELNFQSNVFFEPKMFWFGKFTGSSKKKYIKKYIYKTIPDPAAKISFQNFSVIFYKLSTTIFFS